MKNYLQIGSLVILALSTSACGTLETPSKSNDCRANCERNYSMNKVEWNSCISQCQTVDGPAADVDTRAANVERPSDEGRHN